MCRYNSGCGLAAVEAWEEAEEVLRGAERAARTYLQEEGETEEDIEEEVGIIRVSRPFHHHPCCGSGSCWIC